MAAHLATARLIVHGEFTAVRAIQSTTRPWGFLATLIWAVPILLAAVTAEHIVYVQAAVAVAFRSPTAQLRPAAWSVLAMVCVLTGLTLPALMLRRSYGVANYLGLEKVPWRSAFAWIGLGTLATLLTLSIRLFLRAGPDAHASLIVQDDFLLYVVATVLLGPLSEELFFRGFLITGLRQSRLGNWIAIPLSAAMWAGLHQDARWEGPAALFLFGCLLGVMRNASRSILPGCCVHVLNNAIALALQILDMGQ